MKLITVTLEIESTGSNEELIDGIKDALEIMNEEGDDYGTTYCRVRNILIDNLNE